MRELLRRPEGTYNYAGNDQVRYSVANILSRNVLWDDLDVLTSAVFDALPEDRNRLFDAYENLNEALWSFTLDNEDSLINNHGPLQELLNEFPAILSDILSHAVVAINDVRREKSSARYLKKYSKKILRLTAMLGPATYSSYLSKPKTRISQYLTLDFARFDQRTKTFLEHTLEKTEPEELPTEDEVEDIEAWLESFSSDVLNAYKGTRELLAEVTPLLNNAEAEYFIEQVVSDYYPQIFAALREAEGKQMSFSSKESVVTEALKQFNIIQLGLQKILDNIVEQRLQRFQMQTDFLRNKVVGETQLSLSKEESDQLVTASLEESNRVREELYKKHVSPILEKNKLEYEAALNEAKETCAKEQENALNQQKADYEDAIKYHLTQSSVEKDKHDRAVRVLKDQLNDFRAQKNGQDAEKEELNERIKVLQSKLSGQENTSGFRVTTMEEVFTPKFAESQAEDSILAITHKVMETEQRLTILSESLTRYKERGVPGVITDTITRELEEAELDLKSFHKRQQEIMSENSLRNRNKVKRELSDSELELEKLAYTLKNAHLSSENFLNYSELGRIKDKIQEVTSWKLALTQLLDQNVALQNK